MRYSEAHPPGRPPTAPRLVALLVWLALLSVPLVVSAGDSEKQRIKHTVRKGETVVEIAKRYGVSRSEIVRWNKKRLDDPDQIHPGDRLVLYVPAEDAPQADDRDASRSDAKKTGKKGKKGKRDEKKDKDDEAAAQATDDAIATPYPVNDERVEPPLEGFAYPYSYDNLMRGFDGARCAHQGLDIGGVGDTGGVGDPVFAIVKAEVVLIGLPEEEPKKYGRPDKRKGYETRGGKKMPRRLEVDGYGTVYPFTRTNGTARTGVFLVTRAIGTELDGHKVRYLHLAAVHPELEVGDVVEAGQEVGLMGATGFQETSPHLHLDVEDPDGVRVDPAPFIGLAELRPSTCRPINKHKSKTRYRNKGKGQGKRTRTWHTVKKGDSVSRIAKKYKVSSRDIVKWNKLKDADTLRTGQKLKIYVYR